MATIKTFMAGIAVPPGDDAARLAKTPLNGLVAVLVRATTKQQAHDAMTQLYGITPQRAGDVIKDLRLVKYKPGTPDEPYILRRLREVSLVKDNEIGVWIWFQFAHGFPIVRLTETGPRIVGTVQSWPLEADLIVEPVRPAGEMFSWRRDGRGWNNEAAFLNGVRLFLIQRDSQDKIILKSDLPGQGHKEWRCDDLADARSTAVNLFTAFIDRMELELRAQ